MSLRAGFLISILIISGSLAAQTFEIDRTGFMLYMVGMSALELSNNYFDRQLTDKLTPEEINALDKDDIPWFDRWINVDADQKLKDWSDYAAYFSIGAALVTVYDDEYYWDNLMVYSKILITQSALCKWTKTLMQRKRPYLYSAENERNTRESQHSFYSSHSSTVFSSAVFAYYYYVDNYGASIPVAGLLFGGAAASAALRVASSQHFPTDVLAGAIFGSAVSYFFCRTHQSDRVKFNFGFNRIGLEIYF